MTEATALRLIECPAGHDAAYMDYNGIQYRVGCCHCDWAGPTKDSPEDATAAWGERDSVETRTLAAKVAAVEAAHKQRRSESEDALRSLTPGGSEFQTAAECAEYVRQERSNTHELLVCAMKRARLAESALAASKAKLAVNMSVTSLTRRTEQAETEAARLRKAMLSFSLMLGWAHEVPQDVIERNLAANKALLVRLEAENERLAARLAEVIATADRRQP